ncbi:MAG: hypothetical protein NVS2B12_35570 [Ktedonobacteraceae bacterium]
MKTLYTGHVAIGEHEIYSFIYAETLLTAEKHLTSLLTSYVRQHCTPVLMVQPQIRVVSRPNGWNPPDGYYLPGTSRQYALKYPAQETYSAAQEARAGDEVDAEDEVYPPLLRSLNDQERLP